MPVSRAGTWYVGALAHLASPFLVVTDGQEDLPLPSALPAHSLILGLQGHGPLVLMGFKLNPLPGSCLLLLHPLEDAGPAVGPSRQAPLSWPCPWLGCLLLGWPKYCLSGVVTWQEPPTSYFLQAER